MRIQVKTTAGRKAFAAPVRGTEIPSDRFVSVEATDWIAHLLQVGDLIMAPQEPPKPAPAAAPVAPPPPPAPAAPKASAPAVAPAPVAAPVKPAAPVTA